MKAALLGFLLACLVLVAVVGLVNMVGSARRDTVTPAGVVTARMDCAGCV
jgi:hypothetical protein